MLLPLTFFRKKNDKDSNATNWSGVVVMNPNLEFPSAVWAQEAYEARLKLNPIKLFQVILSKKHRRRMEIVGHEVEVQAAVTVYGVNEHDYRLREAHSMFHGYDGLFDEYKYAHEIMDEMTNHSEFAKHWVSKHIDSIMEYK